MATMKWKRLSVSTKNEKTKGEVDGFLRNNAGSKNISVRAGADIEVCLPSRRAPNAPSDAAWPAKKSLLGVDISVTTFEQAVQCIIDATQRGGTGLVTAFDSRAVVIAAEDQALKERINEFQLVTPDGAPVKFALNLIHCVGLRERVSGPDLTRSVCAAAARADVPVYFFGASMETVTRMRAILEDECPRLKVVGCEEGVYRPMDEAEDRALIDRVNASGARILFVGLGNPRQERFAHDHRDSIKAVQICVGAAFDFAAGTKRRAPLWIRNYGLEWLHRICQEPRRLFWRYMIYSPRFVYKVGAQKIASFRRRRITH